VLQTLDSHNADHATMAAIVAALCRPHAVVATDYESHVMQLLCENISLNSSSASDHLAQHHTNERLVRDLMVDRKCGNCGAVVDIRAQRLDWTCRDDLDQIARFKPSVILAADTVRFKRAIMGLSCGCDFKFQFECAYPDLFTRISTRTGEGDGDMSLRS